MKNKYELAGVILAILGVGFLAVAFTHPEWSFPWQAWVTYTLFVLYEVFSVMIFCMPKMKNAGPLSCVILAIEFIALGCIVISIGIHKETGSTNWYLPAGLLLSAACNFTNAFLAKNASITRKAKLER